MASQKRSPKDIYLRPISAQLANEFTRKNHYSHKVVPNSQVHLGVYFKDIAGALLGVMQYGPSINKKGTINLVEGTGWNEFIELNRLTFLDQLPRNSESRAIAMAHRLFKRHYPHIKWVISFADATQCGDGTIYRASGFVLTNIVKNEALRINPSTGEKTHAITAHHHKQAKEFKTWKPLVGYQLRYVYFLDPTYREKLTVPEIPYSKIKELGVSMYRGRKSGQL